MGYENVDVEPVLEVRGPRVCPGNSEQYSSDMASHKNDLLLRKRHTLQVVSIT